MGKMQLYQIAGLCAILAAGGFWYATTKTGNILFSTAAAALMCAGLFLFAYVRLQKKKQQSDDDAQK